MNSKRFKAVSAGTAQPNTPQTDSMQQVPHLVKINHVDLGMITIKIESTDPMQAIEDANQMSEEQVLEAMVILKATFYNETLNETYTLGGVHDLGHAWSLVKYAAHRKGWNPIDVMVRIVPAA